MRGRERQGGWEREAPTQLDGLLKGGGGCLWGRVAGFGSVGKVTTAERVWLVS